MPKTILDRYNDAGDAGKLGSSSIPTRPLKKVHLVPVWDTDNNVGRVVKASDLLTDNPAFVMTMVMSGAYSIVLGTAVYDKETPPNLVSAEIQWADGTAGTIEREITDGNGSTEDTFSRIIPGATTQWYKHNTLYDVDGTVKGGGFMAAGDGLAVLTVTETLLPFVVYEGDTPDLCETNTGIQAIKLETINTEELVKVVPPSGWKVSSDEGVHWEDELSLDCSDSGVTIWVRLKETVVDAYAGTLSVSVGLAYEEFSLTGYICDGDIAAGLPYYIILPKQLDAVRDHLDADHEQVADIDLAAYANWEPIGTEAAAFTGVYDGAGFKITNLVCETADAALPYHAGLFGYGSGCTLSSLIIEDADVKSEADDAAILIGRATSASVITGCIVSGLAEGVSCGGLVGTANTTVITDCGANVTVTGIGAGKIGGLVAGGGVISDCYALGDVQGTCYVAGGLVGSTGGGHSVTNSYAMGNVTATASGACGGLAGESVNNITKCYSIGAVSGGAANNGLIGKKQNPMITPVADTCLWLQDATLDPTVNVGLATPNFSSNGELQSTMMEADTYGAGGLNWGAEWVFDDGVDYPRLAWESA